MKRLFPYTLLVLTALFVFSCSREDKSEEKEEKNKPVNQPLGEKEGVLGVMVVPEMLAISKLDSAAIEDMPDKLGKNYTLLESEIKAIGAEMDGSPGIINYNNDPHNFKFECLLLIRDMPAKQPKQCKVVILESAKMLIYNYYGPYADMINGYNKIRNYCTAHHLTQNGPMREFYITDPTLEQDETKWLTRIFVPVE